ncbi:MAG: GNAT family N-acetyltransferase [Nanoarchaeota archaeon]|nr:GNAT family N-acetyltransferase [Nanoarchaeota archaeon]
MNIQQVTQEEFDRHLGELWNQQKTPKDIDSTKTYWSFLAHNELNKPVGGVAGYFRWEWAYISQIVIDPHFQGHDYGSKLMDYIETISREENMQGVRLSTLSFQAPQFYEKLGYQEVGRVTDCPPGHALIYFAKKFTK